MTIQVKNLIIQWNRRITPEEDLPLGKYPSDDLNQGRLRPFISFEYNNKQYSFEVMNPEVKIDKVKKEINDYINTNKPLKDCRDLSAMVAQPDVEDF